MAKNTKKSGKQKQSSALPAAVESVSTERPDPVDLALQTKWSFPSQSRCPRCRGTSTRATSTQGKVQYRQCQAPICQKRYTVIGTKV